VPRLERIVEEFGEAGDVGSVVVEKEADVLGIEATSGRPTSILSSGAFRGRLAFDASPSVPGSNSASTPTKVQSLR
jgi:hypothetical protein